MPNSENSNLAGDISANSFPIGGERWRGWYIFIVVLLFGLFAFQLWFHATRTSAMKILRVLRGIK